VSSYNIKSLLQAIFMVRACQNMFNNESTSCEAQSLSSGDGTYYNLMTRMERESFSVASLQASSLHTNRTDHRTMATAPFYQPDHEHSRMSLQGGAFGLPSLTAWPAQSVAESLTDDHHGWETASSPASLARIISIMEDVMAILDADDTIIARIANTSDVHMVDDDFLTFSRNMPPPARQ
jgi:hypothetical protein